MKETTVPIDQAGRIVLPKDIRGELAFKPGETLKVLIHGSSVTLTPYREPAGFVRKGKALVSMTASDESLSQETVARLLEKSRDARHRESTRGLIRRR